ncbi:response regulator transcription factor [Clostridium sp. AL.422]|uniref:response regulator transcription factor n=1 Tax=Clostridium TaxID=1485 RepID=UPI00293DCF17|nr:MULTISPECIES: response regulator transcription factor [unclassified Clostridium]MDV4151342.1 response regulator transcription factor [Clostridium sp. AL.422]
MFKIMIVEDDKKIQEIICENIEKWGFKGLCIQDFNKVVDEFVKYDPHLILMDINLTTYDGFYWCSKIREISKVPIIFISSRNTEMDIIMAVNMGGDDFVQKPFSLEVLMAKINALLRRTYNYTNDLLNIIEYKGAVLNIKDSMVIFEDKKFELTKNEFKILYTLMKDRGNIVSRDKIMRALWEDESFVDDNTLTVNINRLRKKLEELGLIDYIRTKKGQGYII